MSESNMCSSLRSILERLYPHNHKGKEATEVSVADPGKADRRPRRVFNLLSQIPSLLVLAYHGF